MRITLLILFFLYTSFVDARMYQWVEPGVETTQLSGKPPAWYRSTAGGPRVFVFENGRLIDDTAIDVSDEVRQRLRQEAFIIAEEDRQKAMEKIAKANEMKEKFRDEESEEEKPIDKNENEESSLELLADTLFSEEEKEEESESDKNLDELRKIIADWEASQTESARKALE